MRHEIKPNGAQPFIALELALEIIRSLRPIVRKVRKESRKVAEQIVEAASSVAANLAEGNGRVGGDRAYHFRVAEGSNLETRSHLRVALAWGWVEDADVAETMTLIDREAAVLWRLTH